MLTCLGLGIAESIVERSGKESPHSRTYGARRWELAFGFIFDIGAANLYFAILRGIVFSLGVQTPKNPAFWLVRGLAWAVFGVAGGIVYGLTDRSRPQNEVWHYRWADWRRAGRNAFRSHQLCHAHGEL